MDEVLHANIFFVIASIATVAFCILVCVILYHVLKIVRSVRAIVERIEEGSGLIADDMVQVRTWVQQNVVARFLGMMAGRRARRGARRPAHEDENDVTSAE